MIVKEADLTLMPLEAIPEMTHSVFRLKDWTSAHRCETGTPDPESHGMYSFVEKARLSRLINYEGTLVNGLPPYSKFVEFPLVSCS